ncbi:hypothetical protein USDA257_c57220 [Sinorhizobium fredii USDA 257]|uniref:Uncharacterized protein n=1 Tax=Sinorhizobium fredii (strain USDA 257) TaxID=1185652 RepID=I3XEC7_SINF2|nr:hypothetical protein USDA257_c57220 [Sinorhizobium fredii USDA 257]
MCLAIPQPVPSAEAPCAHEPTVASVEKSYYFSRIRALAQVFQP